MTDSETASKFAQIFASSGTVSALQSMSNTGSDKDKAIASQALSSALQNLAQQDALSKQENDYEKKLIGLKDSGKSNSYTAYNMNKLAQIYIMRGQYDLAEPLLQRSLALRTKLSGPDNPEICDTLRSLAEIYFLTGRASKAEANIKLARAIEQKSDTSPAVAATPINDQLADKTDPATANNQPSAQQPAIQLDGMTTVKDQGKDMGAQTDQTGTQLSGSVPQG